MAVTSVAPATTITYFGSIVAAPNNPGEMGQAWQLTMVLPDPLVDFSTTPEQGNHLYLPGSVTVTVGGIDRAGGLSLVWQVLGGYNYGGYYGTVVSGTPWGLGASPFDSVMVRLTSTSVVTSPDGLLLPGIPLAQFENRDFVVTSFDGTDFYHVEGVVGGYTVTNEVALADSSATLALLALALAAWSLAGGRCLPGSGRH